MSDTDGAVSLSTVTSSRKLCYRVPPRGKPLDQQKNLDNGENIMSRKFRSSSNPKRQRMSKKHSRKSFSKAADLTHRKNLDDRPMRGGIRL